MLRWNYKYGLLLCGLLMASGMQAQQNTDRYYLRNGNRLYRDSLYTEAEVDYRKAIEQNNRFPQAYFNLGNALFWQQKPKDAMQAYETAARLETNKTRLASIYHNMGVILQSQKQFAPAIECYKNALRNNPKDDESRYNLVLCQHQLKNNPPQENENKNDKEKKDGDKQNQQQDKQDKQQNQDKDKEKKNQQQEQQKPQNQQQDNTMSKENAEQLLKAAMQNEKETQERLKKQMNQPQRKRLEKQW